jgi:hypothetical protein
MRRPAERKRGGSMKYTYGHYQAHLGVTGRKTCVVPEEVAENQEKYDGKTFPAILCGNKIRVRLVGSDYALGQSGTGEMMVRRA